MGTDDGNQAVEETWAYCPECVRWYYCACRVDPASPRPRCPVCAADPETVQTRPASA